MACIEELNNGQVVTSSTLNLVVSITKSSWMRRQTEPISSRSVHAFVDKKTGEVYKSASWKSPAKGVRFDLRLIEQREWLLENADWAGGYLYMK